MNRKELIKYIKENDSTYRSATFDLYEDEQLSLIKKRIDIEKEKQTKILLKDLSREELKNISTDSKKI